MYKRLALVLTVAVLTACGGGGGNAGTSPFEPGTATPTSTAASVDVLTSAVEVGSGGDQVTITAVVKTVGNASLAAAPITFSTDSGTLSNMTTVTDASGTATAKLSAGANKANRTANVIVTSGAVSGTVAVQITGTKLTFSGATTVALSSAASLPVKATDSKGTPIAGVALTVGTTLNNGLSSAALTTDALGSASLTYTATNSGTDKLTFSGAGATATADILVSAANFSFVSPLANAQIPVATSQSVSVQYLSNGSPQNGRTVNFSATAGTVTPATAITNASGIATVSVLSNTASSAVIQATLAGGGAQATVPVMFVAQTAARVVLQPSPTALAPNTAGSTAQQARLLATVTDANGNPVANSTVSFNRIADPSGGSLSQASAQTDNSGQASVQYIAGALTTSSNGVQLQASVLGTSVVSPITSLTVNQSALFIALGTGNTISNLDEQTYKKDWVVYVTDSNGVAVPNVLVTMSLLPVAYGKGSLTYNGKAWVINAATFYQCVNEDTDYSGVYSASKDFNGNLRLDPGNVISVSTTGGASSATNGTVTTDATGRATISLIYAESYAPWVRVTLQAQAIVSGTQSSTASTFVVSGVASDFTSADIPPAGVNSPFGVNSCATPN